ncbi:hypothetical protein O6H91_09G094800 [Diphasiastrum complanatum]|nr:hypothetical protein O6H91_09G094800 [Diphasiastrum complanatum]
MGSLLKDRDEDLTLFQDMHKRDSNNFLLLSNEDIEASLRNEDLELRVCSEKGSSDLLLADPDKNDYDWLLTPPGTPLFPSLDQEAPVINLTERGSVGTLSSHISKFLGSQSSLSTKVSRGYSSMKQSNLFSIAKNESSSIKITPSKTVPRASSQPSTPTGTSHMQNAARLSSPNTHLAVSASLGTCSNGKVTSSSARCSSTARGISPSKRLPTPYQASQLSLFSVAPSNLRTSISEHTNSSRSSSAHSRHKRNNSVGRVSSHSTWMDSSSYSLRSTVSASPSISCSSSTSLDHERLSPTSRKSSVTSPFDEVQAMGPNTDMGTGGRRISSFCEDDFAQLSTWQIKRPVSQGNPQINFQPFISDSPTSFSNSGSSVDEHCNGPHFASHSARSESGANDSAGCHGNGLLRGMHKNNYIEQSLESSFSQKEKDDILTERFDKKNHKESLKISCASKCIGLTATEDALKRDLILHKDRGPPAQDVMPVESINQEYGIYVADKSHVDFIHKIRGWEADIVDASGNISPSNVFESAQGTPMSGALNTYVQQLQCSLEQGEQRRSVSREFPLNLEDDQVLEKLERCARVKSVGEETCFIGQTVRHVNEGVVLGAEEENVVTEPKHNVRLREATKVISNSNMEVIYEPNLMLSPEEHLILDPETCSFGALKKLSCSLQSSNGLQEGNRDIWSSKRATTFGASNVPEEHTGLNKSLGPTKIQQDVRDCRFQKICNENGKDIVCSEVHSILQASKEIGEHSLAKDIVEDGFNDGDNFPDCATRIISNEEFHSSLTRNGKDIVCSEVHTILQASKGIGEHSPAKLHIVEDGFNSGDNFPDCATGIISNEEFHSPLTGNGKDIVCYEVHTISQARREIGEHSPAKLDIVEDGLNFGDNFPDCATGIVSNEEFHSPLIGNGKDIVCSEVHTILQTRREIGEHSPAKLDIVEERFNFGDNFPDCAKGIISNEEFLSPLTGNEVVKVLNSLEENTDERFVDYDLDTLQLPGLSTVSSADSSPYCMKTKERGNDHSYTCLTVEKDGFEFSGNGIIVKSEACFTEERLPVPNAENSTNSDTLHLTNGHFAIHVSEKNEVTVLDLLSVPAPTSETSTSDFYLTSNNPSKLNSCEEDKAFNTTTGSVNKDHDEGEKYNADMQVTESIVETSSSNVLNDESPSYQPNAAVSGACTNTKEFAPLSGANTDVSAPLSSLLWDKRLLEATDTILFCSSIVHDIIYKASTLAIEKEASSFMSFPAATNKDIPLLFEYSKSQNGNRGRAAKSCKTQAVGAECTTRQKLIYMQQQNRIDSTLVSHPENSVSTMHIDVKEQKGPMFTVVKSSKNKELSYSGQPKCQCTIL